MRELFARHGWTKPHDFGGAYGTLSEATELTAAQRRSAFLDVGLFNVPVPIPGLGGFRQRRLTRRVDLLKNFSETAIATRAIKLIRDGVAYNEWDVIAKDTLREEELQKETDIVTTILTHPNPMDDDFPTFIGQVIEDILIWDAGVWEYVENPSFMEDNKILELAVIPGYTMAQNAGWRGDPEMTRWAQILNIRGIGPITFKDREVEYLTSRKRSWTQFGLSPMEVVVEIIESWLGLASYQKQTASNAYPRMMLYLGDKFTQEQVERYRNWFRSDLTGQGGPGIYGGGGGAPKGVDLKPVSDEGLYLKYQEMLMRVFGFVFGLKPQDFGLERDVNRSTAEVGSVSSIKEAQGPIASLIQAKMNVRVIPLIAKVTGNQKIKDVKFIFKGLDRRDRAADAKTNQIYLQEGVLTPDDVRAELGKPPYPGEMGQLPVPLLTELAKQNPIAFLDKLEIEVEEDTAEDEVRKMAQEEVRRMSQVVPPQNQPVPPVVPPNEGNNGNQ